MKDRLQHPRIFIGHFNGFRKKGWLRYAHYRFRGNSISFSRMIWKREFDNLCEEKFMKYLIHELVHWCQYMFLSDNECYEVYHAFSNYSYKRRLIEKIAKEVAGV